MSLLDLLLLVLREHDLRRGLFYFIARQLLLVDIGQPVVLQCAVALPFLILERQVDALIDPLPSSDDVEPEAERAVPARHEAFARCPSSTLLDRRQVSAKIVDSRGGPACSANGALRLPVPSRSSSQKDITVRVMDDGPSMR